MDSGGVTKHYFVDEAGDFNLLDKRGKIVVGREGVSCCFMVGLVDLPDPEHAHAELEDLRGRLLADPRFRHMPSMQPRAKKTALAFHAKDDPPGVRREVFELLPSLGAKVIVGIRRKMPAAKRYKALHGASKRKLDAAETYDGLVSRIFRDKLHRADEHRVTFARIGKSNRNPALAEALAKAQRAFGAKFGERPKKPVVVASAYPHESGGLQIADYYLWALQRMFEREDEACFQMLAPQYRLVMDLDDKRNKPYGEYYSDHNTLKLAKIKPVWTRPGPPTKIYPNQRHEADVRPTTGKVQYTRCRITRKPTPSARRPGSGSSTPPAPESSTPIGKPLEMVGSGRAHTPPEGSVRRLPETTPMTGPRRIELTL